jgi:O-antigen ligase
MDAETFDRWCERGILGLVLLILVSGPLALGAVTTPGLLFIQGLTIGVLLLWVVRIWLNKSYRMLWAPACYAALLFVLYAIARYSMVVAEGGVEHLARQELIRILIYAALFFAIVNNLSRQECTQVITVTLLVLGAAISLYALYQFIAKSDRILIYAQPLIYKGRASGTYICPNHLAGLLEMILPLGLAYTLTGRFKATTKVFLGYASLVIFAGIAVTISRGAWLAIGVALLVLFGVLVRQHGQRLASVLFLALLLGGGVYFVKNLSLLQQRINITYGQFTEEKPEASRLGLWRPAVEMWQDHRWWGVGPGHFDQRFRAYRPDDIQMRPLYAHNDYLNTLADWGVAGMTLIGAALALLFYGAVRGWKFVKRSNDLTSKPSNRSAFVLGSAVGLVAVMLHSAVDFNMQIPANAILAITLMALLTSHMRFVTERYWVKAGWIGKPLLTLACLAGAVYLGWQGTQRGREHVLLQQAGQAEDLPGKIGALKAAHRIEPNNFETTYEIGETLRLASWQGLENYEALALEALQWFERGMTLNRFDPYNHLRFGMSLHWLERAEEAAPYFRKALELDPRSYFMMGHMGWHYFELENYPEAKSWFEKALFQAHWHPEYRFKKYDTAVYYLDLIDRRVAAQAAREATAVRPIGLP